MKVLIKTTFSGPNVSWEAGTVQEIPDAEARRIIAAGLGEAAPQADEEEATEPVERAISHEPEKAERRPGKGQRRK